MELARDGVSKDINTLRRGIILNDRDEFLGLHEQKYLRGDEFLMENPYKKIKVKTGPTSPRKGRLSPQKRRAKKSREKKAVSSAESNNDF